MFDDPNLHWKTYGYVDYENVAADAAIHNYHTAFAMVPMDAWYVHRPTARLFRNNNHRLSLLIHGNDHTYFELHRPSTPSAQLGLARQALRRIDRFESVSGVPVSRVMAAPHGACSQEMAGALLQTGFDAACISRSSLMSRNPDVTWARSIGFRPAEFLDKGLPVIPRFNMAADPQMRVRFAAFLGQPIIPVGHHDDLKDGLDIIHRIADVVNSIGDARWMDMSRISQTNFQTSRENGVLHVRMFSRRVQVRIPPDVGQICIDRPWLDGTDGNERVMLSYGDSSARPPEPYEGQLVPVEPQTDVTICAVLAETDTARAAPVSRTALRAVIRRQLCEGRDRLRPAVDRLLKRSNKTVSFP
jgi:hypothetical protein